MRARYAYPTTAVVLLATLFLASCGTSSANHASGTTTSLAGNQQQIGSVAAQYGGSLSFGTEIERQTLDPALESNFTGIGSVEDVLAIYGALVVTNQQYQLEMMMAQSVTTTDGGTTWVIKLRPNMKFSDGTPYNADAVVSYWNRIKNPATHSPNVGDLATVASFTATDPQTLTVVLKARNTQWANVLTGSLSFVPSPTAVQRLGLNFGSKPVGAGPFVLTSWVRDSEMVFIKNPTYWNAKNVYLQGYIERPIPDETQRTNAFNTGIVDGYFSVIPTTPKLTPSGHIDFVPDLYSSSIFYNTSEAPFNDLSVRQAFNFTVDRNHIATYIWGDSQGASSGIFENGTVWHDPSCNFPPVDTARAQQLIDSYVAQHGPIHVTLTYAQAGEQTLETAEYMQAELDKLKGVTVQVNDVAISDYVNSLINGSIQYGFDKISGAAVDPAIYNFFYTGGSFNFMHYSNAKVDAALDAARATGSPSQQLADYREVECQVVADGINPEYRTSGNFIVTNSKVGGVTTFDDGAIRIDQMFLTSGK